MKNALPECAKFLGIGGKFRVPPRPSSQLSHVQHNLTILVLIQFMIIYIYFVESLYLCLVNH